MSDSVLARFLGQAAQERRIVQVYRGRLNEQSLRGFVLGTSDEVTILHRIDEVGRDEGITVVLTEDITRATYGHLAIREGLASKLEVRAPLPPIALLATTAALTVLTKTFGWVAVYAEGEDGTFVLGRDIDVDDDHVRLAVLDGESPGMETCIAVASITRLDADGPYERLTIDVEAKKVR